MWRRSFLVGAIVFGAIAGAVVAIQSPRVANNLKTRIQNLARDQAGLRVDIAALEIELLPPAVHLRGVKVRRPDRTEPWVMLHRGRVQVRPWPSPAGALVIDYLELDGLEIDHTLDPEAGEMFSGDFTDLRLPLDIRELLVWNTRVHVHGEDEGIRLEPVDLQLRPHPEGGRVIAFEIPSGHFTVEGRTFAVELRAHARLDGSLDRPRSLSVERAKIFLRQIALSASGQVALSEEALKELPEGSTGMQLTLEGGVSLERLRELVPDLPQMKGDAQLRAEIKGSARNPTATPLIRLEGAVDGTSIMGRTLGTVTANAVVEGSRVTLEAFGVDHPSAGKVTGSGTVDITDRSVNFAARVHRASLPVILDKAGLDNVWVRLLANGDIQGSGKLDPFRISLDSDLEVEQFAVLDDSYREPLAREMLTIANAAVRGPAALTTRGVEFYGIDVTTGNTALKAAGAMSFDPNVGFDLKVSSEAFDLADIGPIAGVDFAGKGTIFAALEGAYRRPSVSGTPRLEGFSVLGYDVGDTTSTVIFEDMRISVDRATIRRGRGSILGGGHIDFNESDIQVAGDFDVKDVDLAGVLTTMGVSPALTRRVGARVSGSVSVADSLTRPTGSINLQSDAMKLDAVAIGPIRIGLDLGGAPGEILNVRADAKPGGARVRAAVGVLEPRSPGAPYELSIDATTSAVDFAYITPLLGDVPFEGKLTSRVALSGSAGSFQGEMALDVGALTAWGVRFGQTRLKGNAVDGKLALSGRTLFDKASVSGSVVLDGSLPYVAQFELVDADVGKSYTLPDGMLIASSGSIFSQGALTEPEKISADLEVTGAKVRLHEYAFELARPAKLTYGERRLDIIDLGVVGANTSSNIGGRIDLDQGIELGVVSSGDLAAVSTLVDSLESARGPFSAKFDVTGPFGALIANGRADVTGAKMRLKTLGQDFESVNATFLLTGRDIEIRDGSAISEGGKVAFSGGVLLPAAEDPAQLRLFADLDRVGIRPDRYSRGNASGRLSLVGPFGDLLLKGRIDIHEMRYVRQLELSFDSFFPRKDAPLKVPDFAPGQRVTVDVHLEIPGTLDIDLGQITGTMQASLDFRGTTESLGLGGTITPVNARARYRDLEFEYLTGDITFTEEFRVMARYDITAEAEGCEMNMTLNLTGDSRGIGILSLTGEDESGPVDEQDPWSCVAYGLRLSQHAGATEYSRALGTERATVEDTIGSGLEILAEVTGYNATLRKIIPYVDEARLTLGRSSQRRRDRRLGPRLVLSKEIGNNLQLKYEGALDVTDDHKVSVEYQLFRNALIAGSWASDPIVPSGDLGLDLQFEWEFD